jgi:hypothetical protein
MRMLKILLVVGCLSTAVWGQQRGPGPAGPRPTAGQAGQRPSAVALETDPKRLCRLEGRTVNAATGEPIQRASVMLSGAGPNATGRSARSDGDGRFLIENVQPGAYRLTAERVGFLRQGYGARTPGGTPAPLNLSPGQSLKDLEIKLTPQGVILGTVFDDEGDPFPRTAVIAYRLGGLTGSQQSRRQVSVSAITNDIGEYRLAGLAPSRYLVVAIAQGRIRRPPGGFEGRPSGTSEEDLLPTYYPSALDPAGAAPVDIIAGQDVGGIAIMLRKGALYRVQGRIVGGVPQDLVNVRVSLMSRSGEPAFFAGGGAAVGPDGNFQITRVQPGSYYLTAERTGRQGSGRIGRISVDVTGADATGLVLPLVEPMSVSGAIRIEGDQKAALPRLTVRLLPIDGSGSSSQNARVAESGTFKLDSVPADNYYLDFGGLPEGAYVKSVRMGNQELLDKGIDLTSARAGVSLEVVLSPRAGSVGGTVTGEGKPAAGSFVVMLADPVRPGQPSLNKSATADQDGRFALGGVAPGDYKLYALEEAQPELVRDPGLTKPLESKAVKVRVEESGAEQVELKIIKPEDAQK